MLFSLQNINPNRLLFRGILALLIGVTIVAVPEMSMVLVMRIIGGLLLVDGLVALILSYFKKKKEPQSAYNIIPRGTLSLIMALILIIFPTLLVNVFVFVIGLILFMAGFTQLVSVLGTRSVLGFSWVSFIIAMVALSMGVVLLAKPFESAQTILIVFGVVIAFYGSGEIFRSFKVRKYQKNEPKPTPEIVDAEYEIIE